MYCFQFSALGQPWLMNDILSVSRVRVCDTSSVYCIVRPPQSPYMWPLWSLPPLPTPDPSGGLCLWACLFLWLVVFCFISHMQMKPYGSCPFLSDLLHVARYSQEWSKLLQMAVFYPFLWLSRISLHTCPTSSVSTHLSVDMHIVSMPWPSCSVPQWT